jgi:cation diffusion facilitator CzcD-associated flavoprotein CzcO
MDSDTAANLAAHPSAPPHTHVAIIGAGFAGLGMAIRLKRQGDEDFILLERGPDVGGTWRDNTYPGCACDVPSRLYSFSFAPNPNWSRAYSPQSEILDYLRDCVKRYNLTPHIRWRCDVTDMAWDEATQRWRITSSDGALTADVLVVGTGALSEPRLPAIPGIERFAGTVYHSARWDHAHDLRSERVAVIGTGASAIQIVPQIQPLAGQITLFQRTPPWIMPRGDRPIPGWRRALNRALPFTDRLARDAIYWQREIIALGMVYQPGILHGIERLVLRHMRSQVADRDLRAKLAPNYRLGCKRILLSDDFYPALTRPNVEVVTQRIREIRPAAIVTEDGAERPVETLILATGFHAAEPPVAMRICGLDGKRLADVWKTGVEAYLGATVAGFPNLFFLVGPNTILAHTSMIFMIESQLNYVLDALRYMDRQNIASLDVRAEIVTAFNERLQRRMRHTVWMSGCGSWYLDERGRNTTLWPGFTWEFWLRARRFVPSIYQCIPARAIAP